MAILIMSDLKLNHPFNFKSTKSKDKYRLYHTVCTKQIQSHLTANSLSSFQHRVTDICSLPRRPWSARVNRASSPCSHCQHIPYCVHTQYTLTDDAFKLSHKLQIKDHILRFMFLCKELQHGTQQFILIDLRMLTKPSKVSLSVPVCSSRKKCSLLAIFKHRIQHAICYKIVFLYFLGKLFELLLSFFYHCVMGNIVRKRALLNMDLRN